RPRIRCPRPRGAELMKWSDCGCGGGAPKDTSQARDSTMRAAQIAAIFPGLKDVSWRKSSRPDRKYNCIAFAAGDESNFWDPVGRFWPLGVRRSHDLDAAIDAFRARGYHLCADGCLEAGIEKIAIYEQRGYWKHAAIQLATGGWKSKLGAEDDIEHATPEALLGDLYGERLHFM